MLQGWVVIAVALGYIGLLFVIASYGDRARRLGRNARAGVLIYPLSLAIYCTSWTFFGSVGLASQRGFDFLTIYVGPMVVIGLATPLILRIVRLAKAQNITSIADFIAARYGKAEAVAATVALIAIIAAAIYAIRAYYKTPNGRKQIDQMLLNAPVLGDLLRKSAVSRFTRTLGTLISSGVSILDGLEITAKTAGNRVIHDAVMESRNSIAGGETIAGPLEKSKVFPPMVISMIAVGEQTGGLDEMLSKIADFYDEEVDVAVSALLSLMEPMMIVFLGVIVGGMVVAMYLPIFDMMNAVQ